MPSESIENSELDTVEKSPYNSLQFLQKNSKVEKIGYFVEILGFFKGPKNEINWPYMALPMLLYLWMAVVLYIKIIRQFK